ncbi:MAG: bifunctional (p)ppGpp synthetase/guanosine-3',5'-bis(diphosphate) 3'-pyrophosphohydrolase [Reyranellaceae bacterium]
MIRQFELVERVKSYDPGVDEDTLNRAYVYTMKAHGGQKRASGDPYFSHPVEVAGILTEMKLDSASIVTALLHDTVEDTVATLDDISRLFGNEIARLVDGVTKLSRLELQSDRTKQAENFRKLLLAMSEDIRVLLVKLADRLHNMRTLRFIKDPDKRRRIARETMEIYAPLAARIGMQDIKDEMEDLAFAELHPEAHDSLKKRLEFLRQESGAAIPAIVERLRTTLADQWVKAEVSGREKTPYSIWRKMETKHVALEQLSDIMAFRVIVDTVPECYQALGVIHGGYRVVPGRFKDYISNPKPNGYKSLHTAVFGHGQQRLEIQIRTREMHDFAERGVAAHWSYKQGVPTDGKQYRWLRELLAILENASSPEEFLEHTKLEMFQDQVFCFSPKGDLINLPRRATPVDFAYAVHSQVGDTCIGAKVNGRMVPLRTELQNGDQVEIITSKAHAPSPAWERFVVTGKARAAIRRFVRIRQREQYVQLGRSMLQRTFKEAGYELTDKGLEGAAPVFKQHTADDLAAAVGAGLISDRDVLGAVYPGQKEEKKRGPLAGLFKSRPKGNGHAPAGVEIRGLIPGMAVHYARCCHPLPGDRIVGIVTTGKGVTIHTIDCDTLESFAEAPERWLDVSWDAASEASGRHIGRLRVTLLNEPGSLSSVANVIAKDRGNISNLKIVNRGEDFFDMLIDIEVSDVKHLSHIIAALKADKSINAVERTRS